MTTGRSVSTIAAITILLAGCTRGARQQAPEPAAAAAAITQDHVTPPAATCAPSGAHGTHAFTSCQTCHACEGVVQFDAAGPAVAPGLPLPAFDAASKTCSNVACHAVPEGTFSYSFPGGDGEPEAKQVPYGGGPRTSTPGWYTTGNGCGACHGMPADGYAWHNGLHGANLATQNACELCHQDAIGFTDTSGVVTSAAIATTSTCGPLRNQPCAPFHRNGTVDVTPRFTSTCIGCH